MGVGCILPLSPGWGGTSAPSRLQGRRPPSNHLESLDNQREGKEGVLILHPSLPMAVQNSYQIQHPPPPGRLEPWPAGDLGGEGGASLGSQRGPEAVLAGRGGWAVQGRKALGLPPVAAYISGLWLQSGGCRVLAPKIRTGLEKLGKWQLFPSKNQSHLFFSSLSLK